MKKKPKLSALKAIKRRTSGERAGTKPDQAGRVKRGKARSKSSVPAASADPKLTIRRLRVATRQGAGANRRAGSLRRSGFPARHPQPARFRARAEPLDRLHQALSRQRRADRARRRSPKADQRRLRPRRRRRGAQGHRGGAAAACPVIGRDRTARRRRVRAAAVELERNRRPRQGGCTGTSRRWAVLRVSRPQDLGRARPPASRSSGPMPRQARRWRRPTARCMSARRNGGMRGEGGSAERAWEQAETRQVAEISTPPIRRQVRRKPCASAS